MPVFKSRAELEAEFTKRSKIAIFNARERIYGVIHNCLLKFYGEYSPVEYVRTEQVLRSLVRSEVVPYGNGWRARVYFDEGALNHPRPTAVGQSGKEHSVEWDEGKILGAVMVGSHGGYTSGTAVWTESIGELRDIAAMVASELRAAGIPVK